MKYVLILGDGMADRPIPEYDGRTPLEYAKTPMLDELAKKSELGMVHTIPEGMAPGSDTANMAVCGYDPKIYYTGRSPLEALSIGVPMKDTDVAIRTNVVTLSDDGLPYEQKTILDHSAGEISTEDAAILIEAVQKELGNEEFTYYTGTSYRHLLIWDHGRVTELTPPHDILGKTIGQYLPKEPKLLEMQKKSYEILNRHPINTARKAAGLNPANSIWFWGAGTKPILTSFEEKTGKKGVMVSAVDLLKGIAVGAGMTNKIVAGANGQLHTNYEGKAQAAIDALLKEGYDFAYIHVEAPDEMGHQGSAPKKVQAIEYLDQRIIRKVKEALDASEEAYRMLILPDHPTPVEVRTHTGEPVPYLLYDSTMEQKHDWQYSEKCAKESGIDRKEGHELIDYLFR